MILPHIVKLSTNILMTMHMRYGIDKIITFKKGKTKHELVKFAV